MTEKTNRALTLAYKNFEALLHDVGYAFGETLSSDFDPYNFEHCYVTVNDKIIKRNQQHLLQRISKVLVQIHTLQAKLKEDGSDIRQSELDTLLSKEIDFIRPVYRTMSRYQNPITGTCSYIWSDKAHFFEPTIKKITINNTVVNAQYALEIMLPKILLLRHIDTLLSPIELKYENLNQRSTTHDHDKKLLDATASASDMVNAAKTARQMLREAVSVREGLEFIENSISLTFEANKETFAEYRGNEYFDAAIDLLRNLAGYVAFILSYPWRTYDKAGTDMYVSSYFEKRQTASLKTFGLFKEKTESHNLAKDSGLSNLEEMLAQLQLKKD